MALIICQTKLLKNSQPRTRAPSLILRKWRGRSCQLRHWRNWVHSTKYPGTENRPQEGITLWEEAKIVRNISNMIPFLVITSLKSRWNWIWKINSSLLKNTNWINYCLIKSVWILQQEWDRCRVCPAHLDRSSGLPPLCPQMPHTKTAHK